MNVGDRVRERYCPDGCVPWTGTVESIAPDGWLIIRKDDGDGKPREGFMSRVSHPPGVVTLSQTDAYVQPMRMAKRADAQALFVECDDGPSIGIYFDADTGQWGVQVSTEDMDLPTRRETPIVAIYLNDATLYDVEPS